MAKVWCVRSLYGNYTEQFVKGGYAAIGWFHESDLSDVKDASGIAVLYQQQYQDPPKVSGGKIAQIARFLFEIQPGDVIVTPMQDTRFLRAGRVTEKPYSYVPDDPGNSELRHRRPVAWLPESIERRSLSVPLQNTFRSAMTVFRVRNANEILTLFGVAPLEEVQHAHDAARIVLDRVLQLDAAEFEELVQHLLAALGFEETIVTGKSGDGGVDVKGVLNASGFARVRVSVQAKRYKDGKISAATVRGLRSAIPHGEQGAFITTSSYQQGAYEVASETGFPLIGLIDGSQLVDLLVENWTKIPEEFRDQLGLKPGLVLT